jgi:glycosyltransferase involved in cell wall biosynthesis
VKDGLAAIPSTSDQAPPSAGEWKFAVEIFPAGWNAPSAPFWIAGWILSASGRGAADVRAWFGGKLFLGLCDLPRAEIENAQLGRAGPPHAGFSFLLQPDREANELRLEACDERGEWREFFRHALAPNPLAPAATSWATRGGTELSQATLRLLVARQLHPSASWENLADEALLSAVALPLDALPNPPFFGRLELPQPVAEVRFGLLEISGWIAHRTERIKRLTAFVGPDSPVVLLHGQKRRDVTAVFGELRDGPDSQFLGFIAVPPSFPEPLSLRILAELETGEQHLVFNQRFRPRVAVPSATALPPFSVTTLARAALALWRASRRRGFSLGRVSDWRRPLQEAAETYRAEAPVTRLPANRVISRAPARPIAVILVTHNLNREGAPLIVLEYAKYLAAQPGWKIRVISPLTGPLAADFSAAGLSVEILDVAPVWQATSPSAFEQALASLVDRVADWRDADVIVANTMVSFWAVHVAQRLRKPSVLYVHEAASVRRFFAALAAPAVLPKIEQAFGLATAVAFSASAAQVAHLGHQREENFRVVPGWIDATAIANYTAAHSRSELRRAKGFPDEAVIFANIGSVSERKGQHIFLDAIEHWQRRRRTETRPAPQLIFLLVGATPSPLVDFLRHEIARRGLAEVQLVEKVSDPYAYFQLADIFVCSSFEESLPRVVLEAAAFGLPVVASAVDGVPEILAPDDAWLVEPGDAETLANAMHSALEAHLAGDRTRASRAQAAVRVKFDAATLLPQHRALATEVAALPAR